MLKEGEVIERSSKNSNSSPPRDFGEFREHDVNNEELEFDVDERKAQIGIDKILEAIGSLRNQVRKRKPTNPKGYQACRARRSNV